MYFLYIVHDARRIEGEDGKFHLNPLTPESDIEDIKTFVNALANIIVPHQLLISTFTPCMKNNAPDAWQ